MDNVASLFARGASALVDGEEEHERETAKLYTKIGQLRLKGISWPGGPGDERPRAQGDGRAAWREFVGSPAMCAAESGAFGRLSPRAGHRRRRSGLDAADSTNCI